MYTMDLMSHVRPKVYIRNLIVNMWACLKIWDVTNGHYRLMYRI